MPRRPSTQLGLKEAPAASKALSWNSACADPYREPQRQEPRRRGLLGALKDRCGWGLSVALQLRTRGSHATAC